MADQKTMQARCLGGFSVMLVTKCLISPVKSRIFCPKLAFLPKIGIFVHFGPGLAGSIGALLVDWLVVVARCISQDTYLLYLLCLVDAKALNCTSHVWPIKDMFFLYLPMIRCFSFQLPTDSIHSNCNLINYDMAKSKIYVAIKTT